MNGAFKHPLRVAARLIWLAAELALAAVRFAPCVLFRFGCCDLEARARWLQTGCRRVLRVFNAHIQVAGPIPTQGLLVSNHLSYLDILVISSLTPSIFVAKREVKNWPLLGWFTQLAGTLFADRERRTQVGALTGQLRAILQQGMLVVLFPEGTSSDGRTILPFKSALLQPATDTSQQVSASLIGYQLEDGDVGDELCYWRDMTFVPHLFNLISKRCLYAFIQFSEFQHANANRKTLASLLHGELLRLKEAGYVHA